MNQFDNLVNQTIGPLYNKQNLSSDIFTGLVYLLLIVYASQIAPQLPVQLKSLFQNTYFKLLAFFLILYLSKYRPSIALLVAVAFVLSVNYANTGKLLEMMQGNLDVQNMQTTNQVMESANNPQTVSGQITLPPMVVQPQVVSTAAGMVVATPQVIIAPLHVTDASSGEIQVVKPVVQIITNNDEMSLPALSSVNNKSGWDSQGSTTNQEQNQDQDNDERKIDINNVYPLIENQHDYYENPTFTGENTTTDYLQVSDLNKQVTV